MSAATKRPLGFSIFAVFLAMQLCGNLVALVAAGPASGMQTPLEGMLALLVAALKAVTVEALWRVRPWATRASGLLSAAVVALLVVRWRVPLEVVPVLGMLFLAGFLAMCTFYVHQRIQERFGPPAGMRVPRPQP
ncbi:hypothetical protein [Longimicrobium sp.]|uniref:hypothetical protein n=1 Tax=Longimicrobium sp. TaxID=2029185 RepID=UPI002D16684D|nr:hypothetical protein [Longimicrobium sp.]HSU13865.1 hypothetical protein [Longimicrobium sp.]